MLTLGLVQKYTYTLGTLVHFHLKGGTTTIHTRRKTEKKRNIHPFAAIHGVVRPEFMRLDVSPLVKVDVTHQLYTFTLVIGKEFIFFLFYFKFIAYIYFLERYIRKQNYGAYTNTYIPF